jgi:hypothetical protein
MYLWAIILPERARGSTWARTLRHLSDMTGPELQTLDVKLERAGHPH